MRVTYIFWGEGMYGESILLELPGQDGELDTEYDKYVLIDGGWWNNTGVKEFLTETGIEHIDYMVISHDHGDHWGGLSNLVRKGWTVDYVYECGEFQRVQGSKKNFSNITKGDVLSSANPENITKGPGWDPVVEVEVLHGDSGSANPNKDSIVLKASLGQSSFIFGADLTSAEEYNLSVQAAEKLSDIQIYKVHHHGSYSSSNSNFLSKMDLQYAIQQDGGSSGHPHKVALERIIDAGGIIYRNDLDGHIFIRADSKGNYEITRERIYPPGRNPSGSWQEAPPELPKGLVADNIKNKVALKWDETILDAAGEIIPEGKVKYNVFRSNTSGGDPKAGVAKQPEMEEKTGIYERLTEIPLAQTVYIDNTIKKNTSYYYRISAVRTDYNYERRYSNEEVIYISFP